MDSKFVITVYTLNDLIEIYELTNIMQNANYKTMIDAKIVHEFKMYKKGNKLTEIEEIRNSINTHSSLFMGYYSKYTDDSGIERHYLSDIDKFTILSKELKDEILKFIVSTKL